MVERLLTLCGLHRAGKGTTRRVLETLIPEAKRIVVSTSDIIGEELINQGVTNFNDRAVKQEAFLRVAQAEGEDWLIKRAAAVFRRSHLLFGILDAVCRPGDIRWLQTLPRPGWTWIPFYLEASFQTRLERARAAALRGEADSKPDEANISEERFWELHFHPTVIHIPGFRDIPGTAVINHNSTVENLGRQIISVLRERNILNDSDYLIGVQALLRFYDAFNRKVANRRLQS